MKTKAPLKVFMIAGENSGDALGASLLHALKAKVEDLDVQGIGGPQMTAEGLDSLFPMSDLAVMGVFEVLPRLSNLLKRMTQAADAIDRANPDVVITIDAPDFCFRVIKKLRKRGNQVPVVHYVAPTVWAWRPGRAAKVAKFLDHVLCLLPFEPPYFEREGLDATFVGHPVVTGDLGAGDGGAFRGRHNIPVDAPVLCVLPGSRQGEVSRLLEVFCETVERLSARYPGLHVVMPTVPHLLDYVRQAVAGWDVSAVVVGADEKADAYAAADVGLAASGTVTLELALAKVPHIIAYRLNALTSMVARMLVKTPYANLINICLGREAVPEYLMDDCTADNLSRELLRLFDDENTRGAQLKAAEEALVQLGLGGPPPGERAADVVLKMIGEN